MSYRYCRLSLNTLLSLIIVSSVVFECLNASTLVLYLRSFLSTIMMSFTLSQPSPLNTIPIYCNPNPHHDYSDPDLNPCPNALNVSLDSY